MLRHVLLILTLTAAALAAGAVTVPQEREQWTMLMRDGHNADAMALLETRYAEGRRDFDTVINLYRLRMSFAEVEPATRLVEDLVRARPDDTIAAALLAKHYADIQNRPGEIKALERLFDLSPSLQTSNRLLALYRLDGAFDREEGLLHTLYAQRMITTNDAERLGLRLAANGDLAGAREVLSYFDEIANPERMIGRLALFDILVRLGDKTTALAKAASWIPNWRKAGIHRPGGPEVPAARMARMMMMVDEAQAREILCSAQAEEARVTTDRVSQAAGYTASEAMASAGAGH